MPILNIWSHPRGQGVCKVKTLACILFYASFSLSWYATWPPSEKTRIVRESDYSPAAAFFMQEKGKFLI